MAVSVNAPNSVPISKPLFRIILDLTSESRPEVALPLAIKDWVRLRLAEAAGLRRSFEQKYGMDFAAFQQAWSEGRIAEPYSYAVERDLWEWEATVTDELRLAEILGELA